MGDRVLRTRLDAKAAEDTSPVVDVVDLCISLVPPDPLLVGARIVLGFDVDAVRRAGRRAQVARNALLLPHLVDMQKMLAAIAGLDSDWDIRVLHGPFLARDLRDRALHALDDGDG